MDRFLSVMMKWAGISAIAILAVLALAAALVSADVFLGADFGYQLSDLLIVGIIALTCAILWGAVVVLYAWVRR